MTWDLAGHLPLPLGVLGHEGSTVIVGLFAALGQKQCLRR